MHEPSFAFAPPTCVAAFSQAAPNGMPPIVRLLRSLVTLSVAAVLELAAVATAQGQFAARGEISGRVTDSRSGAGLPGVTVQVHDLLNNFALVKTVITDCLGNFTAYSVYEGTYAVKTVNARGYADELYDNLPCPAGDCPLGEGTPVRVKAYSTTEHVDFQLDPPEASPWTATVAGRVTASGTGAGVPNVDVMLYGSGRLVNCGVTGGDGAYTMAAPGTAGSPRFALKTSNWSGYLDELFDNLPCPRQQCDITQGALVPTSDGAPTTVDFALDVGGAVTGRVTDAVTHAPIEAVRIETVGRTPSGAAIPKLVAETDADGMFVVSGLAAGRYFVRTANSLGYPDVLYQGLPCTPVLCDVYGGTPIDVTPGQTAAGTDFALDPHGTITGRVTDAGTGSGLEGVTVWVTGSTADGPVRLAAKTDSSGTYLLRGLPTGAYYVRTSYGFADELYDDVPCPDPVSYSGGYKHRPGGACSLESGTPVGVREGQVTRGIDFALGWPSTLGCDVAGEDGSVLLHVPCAFYRDAVPTPRWVGSCETGDRRCGIQGLGPGLYYVTAGGNGLIAEVYPGFPFMGDFSQATPIALGPGEARIVEFALAPGEVVSGRVVDAESGAGLPWAEVRLHRQDAGTLGAAGPAFADAAGAYRVTNVLPGSYYMSTGGTPPGFVNEWFDNVPCIGPCHLDVQPPGAPVVIEPDSDTRVDFALSKGGSIAGVVSDAATGAGIPNVRVEAYRTVGGQLRLAGEGSADESGAYVVQGLPSGSYFLQTVNYESHIDEVFPNEPCITETCDVSAGTPVSVVLGATTGGVDFALEGGGGIFGWITDETTGADVKHGSVRIFRRTEAGTMVLLGSWRSLGGVFETRALPPGTYFLATEGAEEGGYGNEVFEDRPCPALSCPLDAATPVTVTAGEYTYGVDFRLSHVPASTLRVGAPLVSVKEGARRVAVAVTRQGGLGARASATVRTEGGSAAADADYFDFEQLLTFEPGETGPKAAVIPVTDDDLAEGREWFRVTLTHPSANAQLGTPPGTTVVVLDDDGVGPGAAGGEHLSFDGDGRADVAVYRPSSGQWFVLPSGGGFSTAWPALVFGSPVHGDVPLFGDFDGDKERDLAVYRPATGTWFWLESTAAKSDYDFLGWGVASQGDTPVSGDFDGDGRTDPTVYRPQYGTWFILNSASAYRESRAIGWGEPTDQPVPGDYDGDGASDVAVYRPSTGQWFLLPSSSDFQSARPPVVYGQTGDVPVHGDFDGDGKTDLAVYRAQTGTWFWLESSTNNLAEFHVGWGVDAQGDRPVPGDYDGDGKTDPAVYRPVYGTWFVLKSSTNYTQYVAYGWGALGDLPVVTRP